MADLSVTSVNLELLSSEEMLRNGFTHKATIDATDINTVAGANGDTVTCTLGNTGSNFLMSRCAVYVETAFATTGTLTLQVGTDGDPDNFLVATTDVKTAGPVASEKGAVVETEAGSYAAASDVLVARFTTQSATGKPGDITAGRLHIFLHISNLDVLANGRRA